MREGSSDFKLWIQLKYSLNENTKYKQRTYGAKPVIYWYCNEHDYINININVDKKSMW